jgi:hypothetical protein
VLPVDGRGAGEGAAPFDEADAPAARQGEQVQRQRQLPQLRVGREIQ